jgi:hypothetical protein
MSLWILSPDYITCAGGDSTISRLPGVRLFFVGEIIERFIAGSSPGDLQKRWSIAGVRVNH